MKDHRISTVIMYITSVPDSGVLLKPTHYNTMATTLLICVACAVPLQGHTVFPCIIPVDDSDHDATVELQQKRTDLCIAAARGGNKTAYGVNDPDEFMLRRLSADICAGRKPVRAQL